MGGAKRFVTICLRESFSLRTQEAEGGCACSSPLPDPCPQDRPAQLCDPIGHPVGKASAPGSLNFKSRRLASLEGQIEKLLLANWVLS